MCAEVKITEWRPGACGSRLGDIVLSEDGKITLKVKCRRCSKRENKDVFHSREVGKIEASDE